MKRKIEEKLRAIKLRERGYSLNEIYKKLNVAKSSASVWVRNVPLSSKARKRLLTKIKLGQLISAENKRKKTQKILDLYRNQAVREFEKIPQDSKEIYKLICALLYWCEGTKNYSEGVNFTNSDPRLIQIFLYSFRKSFDIDERKFRPCVHVHEYHNPKKQIKFWSDITNIPVNQFIKPYLKSNTRKRIKKDYPGCIGLKYHSNDIAKRLFTDGEAFLSIFGSIG